MSSVVELATKNGKPRHRGKVKVPNVTLAHGGGGKAMHDLIDDIFVEMFDSEGQAPLEDQARVGLSTWRHLAIDLLSPPIPTSSSHSIFPAATSASSRSAAR